MANVSGLSGAPLPNRKSSASETTTDEEESGSSVLSENSSSKPGPMVWSSTHNSYLLREIFANKPWIHRFQSVDRGAVWRKIAENLNACQSTIFRVDHRSVRDHYNVLKNKYHKKQRDKTWSGGIGLEEMDDERLLAETIDRFAEYDWQHCKKQRAALQDKQKKSQRTLIENLSKTFNSRDCLENDGDEPASPSKIAIMDTSICLITEKSDRDRQLKLKEMTLLSDLYKNLMEKIQENFKEQRHTQEKYLEVIEESQRQTKTLISNQLEMIRVLANILEMQQEKYQ
ncbi:hypothetical protein TrispH2_011351 [Trichoplax sp. H2]|nr:hypothetical protein TrispH2_011351 [Trichoplax sp. H2]|eukprot:RDD36925.1 hypothetical protein TrispH2_011351 [Trichoplax sp. H2]